MLLSWVQKLFRTKARTYRRPAKTARRRGTSGFRPGVEGLEERVVPSFLAPVNYSAGTSPTIMMAADFNGDGKLDLAAANNTLTPTVSVLLGNGDGTFQAPLSSNLGGKAGSPYTGAQGHTMATADFNGDGHLDLAVVSGFSAMVLMGNGDGTFQAPRNVVLGTSPTRISTADVNADGHADLLAANTNGTVSVLLGNGTGTFQALGNLATGSSAQSVAVGDFNNDGRPDFAVNNYASGSLSVFMNAGSGNFSSSTILAGATTGALAAGDFNGDGVTDLAVPATIFNGGTGFSAVKVYTGQTAGTLQPGTTYALGLGFPVVGDFNGDGRTDLVGTAGNAIEPWLATGNGTLQAPYLISAAGVSLSSQATADFNGGGIPDLVSASTGQVQLGLGDGRFGDPTTLLIPGSSTVAAVDADGNGTPDVLVGNAGYSTGQVAAWLNSPGYDNRTGGAVGFTIAAPQQVTAGGNTSVRITAVDALGNVVPGFLGTVDLDNTPAGSTALNLSGQYTFTAADNGRHPFLFSNLTQAGTYTLSTYAVDMATAKATVSVTPAAPAKFVFSTPASVTAGTPFSYTVTSEDAFGNIETGYTGTVHFTASTADTQAVPPADYTFTAADAGRHTFTATLKTAGAQTLTFADTFFTALTATEPITVSPAAAASFVVTGFPATTAGVAHTFTVTVKDSFGNVASNYTGTVAFSSSDPLAALPASYAFTSADAGVHAFTATLKKAGTQSITVTDKLAAGVTGTQTGIAVSAAAVDHFALSVPASVTQGVGFSFTVSAVDAFGNVNTGYRGTVHLSSTDPTGGTQNFTFSNNDNGVHVFSYTFNALGFQTLTIVDTTSSSIAGSAIVDVLAKSGGGGGGGGGGAGP